ncbi:MAG: hypothetical protein E7632_10070 [Ruminococcaceae bacterium]|nr:hypothetical protein [Oscillospiraceae bacterium]
MKRILTVMLMLLMLFGCGERGIFVEERPVAIDWRRDLYSPSMLISWAIKWEELPDIVEISDAAVIATVEELSAAEGYRDERALTFTYQLEIAEVLFDTAGDLSAGDSVTMISGEGAMPLSELKPKLDYTGSVYIPKHQGDAPDDSWLIATNHDTTPIEVGREYLLFLEKDADSGGYIEYGHRFLWEIMEGRLVCSDGLAKWYDDEYSMEAVRDVIASRTGRCDEIGETAYADEVNEREAAELEAAQTALRTRMEQAAAKRTGEVVPIQRRNIVHTIEYDRYGDDTLEERLADCEAAALVRLTAKADDPWDDEPLFDDVKSFYYHAEVVEILHNPDASLSVGDAVTLQLYSGVMEAWRMQEEIGLWKESIDKGILQDAYLDEDYAAVMTPRTIPAEVGKTYFILLKSPVREGYYDYFECGGAYFYEYRDGKLYTGDGKKAKKAKISLEDIKEAMEGGHTG